MLIGEQVLVHSTIAGVCYPMAYIQLSFAESCISAQQDFDTTFEAICRPLLEAQLHASEFAELFSYIASHVTWDPLPVPHELRTGVFTSYELFFSKKGTRVCAESELGFTRQHGEIWELNCIEVVCEHISTCW